jgi:3-hydroxyacyl-[acyl-carrier-protein] dehydratase
MTAPARHTDADVLSPAEVLAAIPQQEPFRFVDRIVGIDDEHVVATYRFRATADFYRGHFPGRPITPGVLLIESMAQAGVVALGVYLLAKELGLQSLARCTALFTDAAVEFSGILFPDEQVTITGRKVFFRRLKLRSQVEMRRAGGELVCAGTLAGMVVTT